jgi:hypothetical protein
VTDTLDTISKCPPFQKTDIPISNNKYHAIKCLLNTWMELDGVTMAVNRLQIGQHRVKFLSGTKDLSLLQNFQTSSGTHPAPYSMGNGVLS